MYNPISTTNIRGISDNGTISERESVPNQLLQTIQQINTFSQSITEDGNPKTLEPVVVDKSFDY